MTQKIKSQLQWTIPDCAQNVIDMSHETLRGYIQNDYIKPDHPAEGKGSRHLLSAKNAIQAKVFEYMVRRGILKKEAKEIVEYFNDYDPKRPYLHIFKKGDGFRVKWFSRVQQNKSEFEMLIIINVNDIINSVNSHIIKRGGVAIQLS